MVPWWDCMIDDVLLEILVCPESKQPVSMADASILDRVNTGIAAGTIRNRGGTSVGEQLKAALVREDGRVIYPVRDEIPVMLIDEAIELDETT